MKFDSRDAAIVCALLLATLAAGMSWQASSLPWRTYAVAQEKVVGFREIQLRELQSQIEKTFGNVIKDERNKTSDAIQLLRVYDQWVSEYFAANNITPEGQLADAIERAQSRLEEWTQ